MMDNQNKRHYYRRNKESTCQCCWTATATTSRQHHNNERPRKKLTGCGHHHSLLSFTTSSFSCSSSLVNAWRRIFLLILLSIFGLQKGDSFTPLSQLLQVHQQQQNPEPSIISQYQQQQQFGRRPLTKLYQSISIEEDQEVVAPSSSSSSTTTTTTKNSGSFTPPITISNGRTLSPYQIIYPTMASLLEQEKEEDSRGVPLFQSLQIIKQALEKIVNAESQEELYDMLTLGPLQQQKEQEQESSISMSSSVPTVLRIEQTISHTVDPLGWLYAQNQRQLYNNNKNNNNNEKKDPLFYIQSTVETAVFGAAWTWDQSTKVIPTTTTKNDDGVATQAQNQQQQQFWNVISSLPQDSYVYGGERFDQNTTTSSHVRDNNNNNRNDWKDFGSTWWILPAVELRQEPVEHVLTPSATTDSEKNKNSTSSSGNKKRTTLGIHLVINDQNNKSNNNTGGISLSSWQESARYTLQLLQRLSDTVMDAQVPATTLPPVLLRESTYTGRDGTEIDGQDLYERGVTAALDAFAAENNDRDIDHNKTSDATKDDVLKKVVLARRMDLKFQADLSALDILRKWKYNDIHEGGNMFYLRPSGQEEFFGCTPERLFTIQKNSNIVLSEALAGTRPRGTTAAADKELLRDLFGSLKDRNENAITADFIRSVFGQLGEKGLVETTGIVPSSSSLGDDVKKRFAVENQKQASVNSSSSSSSSGYFVRRLRHLMHICQRFSAELSRSGDSMSSNTIVEVVQHLLANLHPTPAVCGFPAAQAIDFIREHESIGFDRGFYAGPVGYMGRNAADILVAIRSGLVSHSSVATGQDVAYDFDDESESNSGPLTKISVYAGAGLVPGSTVQGEWAETSYKLGVISSLFPPSPMTLQSAPTPNVAWASAFVEELIRNGITQFYICPGSRSTPLVVAIAKAARSNVGVVNAVSVHDERGAGFRAVGYGRGASRPAAIITSSGTAVANLYPAIVEAGMDGVPMLILTADRPYENRDTGANQAIDQVKAYSASYIRWFRDILPPHDDVPVSVALADAGHAVTVATSQRGPVHVNIQFRENLAPDAGPIRSDNRADSISKFNGFRFTDVPGFARWSTGGERWLKSYVMTSTSLGMAPAVADIARLIVSSKRGIIVVGNIRRPTDENDMEALSTTSEVIANFAERSGFPIIAGAQNAHLRFSSSAVIPFAEHILKNPTVAQRIKPDLIFQIGAPLVSTEVPSMIVNAMRDSSTTVHHILLHPHQGSERADPSFTASRKVSAEISPFLKALSSQLDANDCGNNGCSSELSSLVRLGRQLQKEIPAIINVASQKVSRPETDQTLTEPQVVLALSTMLSNSVHDQSLFLSNSMPVRDAEFFLYPTRRIGEYSIDKGTLSVGTNRGASGIDGIIASATGFAESTGTPTTLLIGDLAALHDLNSFHAFKSGTTSSKHPLTTILVNNDGGGIFSFLPIASHGADVSFDDFFGTPTSSCSYKQAAEAFGLEAREVSRFDSLCHAYVEAIRSDDSSVIEAQVVSREQNVAIHKQITDSVNSFIDAFLSESNAAQRRESLPTKFYSRHSGDKNDVKNSSEKKKSMVLIHGWMGDKSEWDLVGPDLESQLGSDWDIISVDLPAHGASRMLLSSDNKAVRSALNMDSQCSNGRQVSVNEMAKSVLLSLSRDYGVTEIDALAGYSLGGRVALAMKRLCSLVPAKDLPALVKDDTRMILLSSYPGVLPQSGTFQRDYAGEDMDRLAKDDKLFTEISAACRRADLTLPSAKVWADFLHTWYGMPMWGEIARTGSKFHDMIEKRKRALTYRGRDLAEVLRQSSPPRNNKDDWRGAHPENTLFLAGRHDSKYVHIGEEWSKQGVHFVKVPESGHALLVEAADVVAREIVDFVSNEASGGESDSGGEARVENIAGKTMPALATAGTKLSKLAFGQTEENDDASFQDSSSTGAIDSVDFDPFMIDVVDESRQQKGVFGIGWGDQAKKSSQMTSRSGYILQLTSGEGSQVGVGEISPLPGLHHESTTDAEMQLDALKSHFEGGSGKMLTFSAPSVLALNGKLREYIQQLAREIGLEEFFPSVHSGLEMALISLASQVVQRPLHQALVDFAPNQEFQTSPLNAVLPLNGLITRGSSYSDFLQSRNKRSFPSLKVKVGHQNIMEDASAVSQAMQQIELYGGASNAALRADANRAWDDDNAIKFATALEGIDVRALDRLEFVEEPLMRQSSSDDEWSLEKQVHSLERWYMHTGIPYGVDETLADLAEQHNYQFAPIQKELISSFGNHTRGCSAFVLKPALIGLELSIQLARLARNELGIGVTFSSSFDSGIGLAYTAILGALADSTSETKKFSHGVGTFTMLDGDTLTPSFSSYVNDNGFLNILSISRALNGLGLDELRDSYVFFELLPSDKTKLPPLVGDSTTTSAALDPTTTTTTTSTAKTTVDNNYEASTATSSSGREINLVVSLPLPFSADIACTRFTDFPQQSRWSPWIRSVRYLDDGRETEWTLNVRGVQFKWRAVSSLLEPPLKGIQWESISGLKNKGIVEFLECGDGGGDGANKDGDHDDFAAATTTGTSVMKVRMSIMTPRILASIFQSTPVFVEDFLRNKLLKWSLEMFRDVVKGDLALERGDVELGDALFSSVEGKASAIEATLSSISSSSSPTTNNNKQKDEEDEGFS